ncbi:MAG: hypothetical protein LBU37_15260, partial [Tannerellaceae bacterium]|nr:hypothetical protein [Tannerellaceae bacterium]
LSFVRENQHLQSLLLSFHSQGVICYVQGGDKMKNVIEKMLKGHFKSYKPVKMNVSGMAFYYYADVNGRFFGYFIYNGVWVGSYSKKLLEKAAGQQLNPEASFPEEMKRLRSSFDTNAPLNIIFPAKELNLYVLERGATAWRITDKWLAADLFLSEENLCCYGSLPNEQNKSLAMYKSMGDTISARIRGLYSSVRLSFRIDREEERVYYTGCMPVRK